MENLQKVDHGKRWLAIMNPDSGKGEEASTITMRRSSDKGTQKVE